MTPRREFLVVLAIGVVGAGVLLLAAGRTWAWAMPGQAVPPVPLPNHPVDGTAIAPAVAPLGLASLAGIVGVLATGGWARRLIGAVVACCGAAAGISAGFSVNRSVVLFWMLSGGGSVGGADGIRFTAWPWIACAGGALVAAFGVLTLVRAPHWPGMGRRYDAPRRAASDPDTDMWRALDRGDDPTA